MPVDVDQFENAKRKRKENKTDQLNADDLIQPITVQITDANNGNAEQLLALSISGGHKPYKPCHTMIKLLSFAWGHDDPNTWIGKFLRLYCDPEVINRGEVVGGIRVSHVSHIEGPKTRKLNEKRGQRKAWTVLPLDMPDVAPIPTATDFTKLIEAATTSEQLDELAKAIVKAKLTKDEVNFLKTMVTDARAILRDKPL